MFLAAAIQMTSRADPGANLNRALSLVDEAADRGATLIGLPEMFLCMGRTSALVSSAEPLDGPSLAALATKARQRRLTLVAGSIVEGPADATGRFFNTSVVFGPDGARLGVYRKRHLFDLELPDGSRYRESDLFRSGEATTVAPTPQGPLGMAICYDLRFPELFRELSSAGAELIALPSAFTLHTGRDHWEVLCRARAIENLCYLVAPAQWGRHDERKQTFGHALICDPWGQVLATAPEGEGVAVAPVDLERLARLRAELPALQHRRLR